MKSLYIAGGVVVGVVGLKSLSRRLALHQQLMPQLTSKINTQVHRINQH